MVVNPNITVEGDQTMVNLLQVCDTNMEDTIENMPVWCSDDTRERERHLPFFGEIVGGMYSMSNRTRIIVEKLVECI